jgi:hypothetical protein
MQSWKFGMTAAELETLQEKSVEVLELLKSNLPEKNGVTNAWKFEKAHSILHKVLELILFAARITNPYRLVYIMPDILLDIGSDIGYDFGPDLGHDVVHVTA